MKRVQLNFIFSILLLVTPLLTIANADTAIGDSDIEESAIIGDKQEDELPKVFLIGEHAEAFDAASNEYNLQLLEACDQDMNLAYYKWLSMLQQMEEYAHTLDFPIKGVKMWIKVFWSEDGTIDHIAYYLKPNSRNVNVNEMSAFFISFMEQYQFPLIAESKYSNYGSAAFPVLSSRVKSESN